jgi:hypothetical protein
MGGNRFKDERPGQNGKALFYKAFGLDDATLL